MIASARMTNEEMFLAKRLAAALGIEQIDIVPRHGEPDGIMIVADRNPNTTGAKVLGLTGEEPGSRLSSIADGVRDGSIKTLIVLGEDVTGVGLPTSELAKLDALIATDILPTQTTAAATVVLPGCAWAEKRGSMINIKARLQRLNRAVQAPGSARDDWEILRDLILAVNGTNGLAMIEDVFQQMAAAVPAFANLNLSKIGDLGVPLQLEATA